MVTDTYGDRTFGDKNKNCNLERFCINKSTKQSFFRTSTRWYKTYGGHFGSKLMKTKIEQHCGVNQTFTTIFKYIREFK